MAIYNTEKYVGEAIESLMKSFLYAKNKDADIDSYLIIRNDGSTDNSKNVITSIIKKYSNIFLLENIKNVGVLETRKDLFLDAHEFIKDRKIMNEQDIYLSFFDSDDICVETRVFNQIQEFENDSSLKGCGGQALLFQDDPGVLHNSWGILSDYKKSYDEVKVDSLFQSSTLAGTMSFKYQWIKKRLENLDRNSWWSNVKMGEDWAAIVDFMSEKDFKYKNINEIVLLYRKHGDATTNVITDGVSTDQAKIRNKALSYLNLKLTEQEHLLHITISPCRHWGIYNVDFFQNNQKNIYEMSEKLMKKIIESNKQNNFYNQIYLEKYITEIMNNIKIYQYIDLSSIPQLLKIGK